MNKYKLSDEAFKLLNQIEIKYQQSQVNPTKLERLDKAKQRAFRRFFRRMGFH